MKLTLSETLNAIESAYPPLRETARLVLAVSATTRLDRDHPLAVILIGGPSSGKTSILMPLTKGKSASQLSEGVLRIDDFTPASLVSHAANKSAEQLAKIDLLPQMKDKVVVVKEMAPMFTGHEEDLLKKFAVFASILDGEGHVSGSGSYGRRGYTEKITFSLLGAVTPDVLTQRVYNSLNAIGPRFCFWEMPKRELDPENWRGPNQDRKQIELEAYVAMGQFVEALFEEFAAGSVGRERFAVSEHARDSISRIASLMALLRSKISIEKEDDSSETTTESPDRAFRYLEQIVLGSALADGRYEVADDDLRLALGVALGSALPKLRRVIGLFFRADMPRTNHDISTYLGMSSDSAAKYASQLSGLKVIEKVNADGTTQWDLRSPFKGLRSLFLRQSAVEVKPVEEPRQVTAPWL